MSGWFPGFLFFCELNKIFWWPYTHIEFSLDKRLDPVLLSMLSQAPCTVARCHHERKTVKHFYPKCYINAAICYLTFCWQTKDLKSCYFLKNCSCWQWSVAVQMWSMASFHNIFIQTLSSPQILQIEQQVRTEASFYDKYYVNQQTLNAKEQVRNKRHDPRHPAFNSHLYLTSLQWSDVSVCNNYYNDGKFADSLKLMQIHKNCLMQKTKVRWPFHFRTV